jgi:hypothetical protein
VLSPGGGLESWTVIGAGRRPIEPLERYLAWLTRVERSPNTVRADAQDLKAFWVFLEARGLRWDRVTLEQLGQFTGWLRRPADNVIVLASGTPRRSARTVNRMRRLRSLGALYLQDGCCLLPRSEQSERDLATVAAKVREVGGEATLPAVRGTEPGWEDRLTEAFNRLRAEEHEELLATLERFDDELARESRKGKFTFAVLEELEDEHAKLERWAERIRGRDVLGAPLRSEAEAGLAAAKRSLEDFAERVQREEGANGAPPHDRPTRAACHIADRGIGGLSAGRRRFRTAGRHDSAL